MMYHLQQNSLNARDAIVPNSAPHIPTVFPTTGDYFIHDLSTGKRRRVYATLHRNRGWQDYIVSTILTCESPHPRDDNDSTYF